MLLLPPYDIGWMPPTEFPNLSEAEVISYDLETYDPELLDHGPGYGSKTGYIVGAAVAVPGAKWYFPIRNELGEQGYLPGENVLHWLRDTLGSLTPKVGANLTYDRGWLAAFDIHAGGIHYDVQFAEALLSERDAVNLEALGRKYCGAGKESPALYKWASLAYGGPADQSQRANIYRSPMTLVGPYAESDAELPLGVLRAQWPKLQEWGLTSVFELECRMIPLMNAMRMQGVAVDVERAEILRDELKTRAQSILLELEHAAGKEVSVNSSKDLALLADKHGIKYGRTKPTERYPDGQPSFTKDFLETHTHPLLAKVVECRELLKMVGTFLEGSILNAHKDGIVRTEFHQLRAEHGTRSGRLSATNPNLQNAPGRTALGKRVRSLFVPFRGHDTWLKSDYSQIEYRCLAHFACGGGADELRAAYLADARTDYHVRTHGLVLQHTGKDYPRGHVKTINFGLLYGMGLKALAADIGQPINEVKTLFDAYHAAAPYVNDTMRSTMSIVNHHGFITTILGRRSYFDLWEPARNDRNDPLPALSYARAKQVYGPDITRAYAYRGLNRRLQGSAADIIKTAMVHGWESGHYHRFQLPSLTVHDELGTSYNKQDTDPKLLEEARQIMENAIQLRVPIIVDMEEGPNWADVA